MQDQQEQRAAFKTAYAALNAAQKEAVDTIEGSVMVIAGPGTGKTQVLTLRIANILIQTDAAPENILALTFTESGANAMRERLRHYVGSEAYRVAIHTFHGFAGQLIGQYPDAFPLIIGGRPASELEKIKVIETIIDDPQFKLLRPIGNPQYYVPHIMRILSTLKQEYITPDRLAEIITTQESQLESMERVHQKGAHKGKVRGEYAKKEKGIVKNRELLAVYRRYQVMLTEQSLFDFDDMIMETVVSMETQEDMLRDLQEQYQYILADEHQDVNGSQNRILELLAHFHDAPNIFVVGDEKQAIYRFQGASLENFLYFEDLFSSAKTISLTDNYRSGQLILDAAHSLVAVDTGPVAELRIPLQAVQGGGAAVVYRSFPHQVIEDDQLVAKVKEELAAGISPEEIAVIVRTNREVERLAELLRKHQVPATASADGDILRHPTTRAVRDLLAALAKPENEQMLFTVLHGPYWGINEADLLRTLSLRSYECSLASILHDATLLQEHGVTDPASLTHVATVLKTARERLISEAPHQVLEYVLHESGFIDHVMSHDPLEGARVLRRLYDEIEAMVEQSERTSVSDILAAFTVTESYGLSLTAPFITTNSTAVQVMTAHKSKGLEFTTVFAPHLCDSVWGGTTKRTYFDVPLTKHMLNESLDPLDDERRLLYVVMTRAKQRLFLSYAELNTEGKPLVASRLLEEIDPATYTRSLEEPNVGAADLLADLTPAPSFTIDVDFLRTVFAARGFSATSFNNYLRHPWDFVYRNILRIPEVQPVHMQFGTAIHGVLQFCTHTHTQTGAIPNDTVLKQRLENELGKLPLSTEDFSRLLQKGLEVLSVYVPSLAATLPAATKEEFKVRVVLETGLPELPEVPLTGMFDRIDLDERGQAFRVVDYKTGKPKTRNTIEGKTANSDGGYKRQLVFYALLLSLYDDDRYRTSTGVLSFVEPDTKGQVREETFAITTEEMDSLKTEIVAAAAAIANGTFLERSGEGSEYAYLVERWQQKP